MKTLILVFLVFFLCGCNKKSDESVMLERCQQQVFDLNYSIAFRLSEMYQEVASCALLAKCVGAQIGEVEPVENKTAEVGTISYGNYKDYKCVIKKNLGLKSGQVERINLDKIKPMLEGCLRGK